MLSAVNPAVLIDTSSSAVANVIAGSVSRSLASRRRPAGVKRNHTKYSEAATQKAMRIAAPVHLPGEDLVQDVGHQQPAEGADHDHGIRCTPQHEANVTGGSDGVAPKAGPGVPCPRATAPHSAVSDIRADVVKTSASCMRTRSAVP